MRCVCGVAVYAVVKVSKGREREREMERALVTIIDRLLRRGAARSVRLLT